MYQIPTTSFQHPQWVVGYGWYHIVGDSLNHNSQNTIFMLGIVGSIFKIVKDEHKVLDTLPQCSHALAYFIFIALFDFSSCDDLTRGGSLMKLPIMSFQCLTL
jgi:hypothetical protein